MITKLGAILTLAVATLFFAAPTTVYAADSTQTQIKSLEKQLKKLPTGTKTTGATYSQINKILKKLVALNPSKSATYYSQSLTKLIQDPNAEANAKKLQTTVTKGLKKSDLSSSQIKKINKKVSSSLTKYTPYQW
jgi:predicted PurR-regulated permease PerM